MVPTVPYYRHSLGVKHTISVCFSVTEASLAQREVEVQRGPLFRTVGSHITIWCTVRGYQGPPQQHFRWSIYLPSAPEREVQMVSTEDASFSYAIYSQRVRGGDIYVERASGDRAVLHIRQLQERDSGEYECHTPNTDPTYHGSYSAKVNLTVIPDTLRVTMAAQKLLKSEGDPMALTCFVSRESAQHTHLSVTWLLENHIAVETQILTLTRDFVLTAGPGYSERFASGDLRLDKLNATSYRLSTAALRVTDGGNVSCRASEWIQDPADIWTEIMAKQSEKSSVGVSAREGGGFVATLRADGGDLIPGKPLEVFCSISSREASGRRYHVEWLLNNSRLGTWYPSGVFSFEGQHGGRGAQGELVLGRRSQDTWYLRISRVRVEDGGSYSCVVSEEESGGSGTQRTQTSNAESVTVTEIGPSLGVALSVRAPGVAVGGAVGLICAASAQYSLANRTLLWAWDFCPGSGPCGQFLEVVRMSPNGDLSWGDSLPGFQGKAQLSVSGKRSTLSLHRVQRGQSGSYRCRVRTEETTKASAASNNVMIQVSLPGSQLKVDGTSRVLSLSNGDEQISVSCRISARTPHTFLNVTWLFRPVAAPSPREILRVSQDGVSTLLAPTQDSRFLSERVSSDTFILRILRPDLSQLGSYHCVVGECLRGEAGDWIPLEEKTSGHTTLEFRRSEKNLNIPKTNSSVEVVEGQDVVLRCPLGVVPNSVALYSVSWYYQDSAPHPARLLFHAGWDGVTRYEGSQAERLRLLTASRGNYSLILHGVGQNDSGTYHCRAEEWRQQAGGGGRSLEDSDVSGYTRLTVTAPGDHLSLNCTASALLVPAPQSLLLPCQVLSVSRTDSALSVSWWRSVAPGAQEELLFRVSPWGQFKYPSERGARLLQFERPSKLHFQLRILQPEEADGGVYHCRVLEWAPDARGVWNPGKERRAGNISVTVLPAGGVSEPLLCSLVGVAVLCVLLVSALVWLFLRQRRLQNHRLHPRTEAEIPMKDRE
ncbi:immunoglobulin superfamily member 3-like [Spea bombifrons]|uniref:immunoglobulin superfamily member 3-like n=1 Tax=Spea bombifrons TaxID=233779 RepID=UPI00234AC649|nr:immunoglobulin superfamily member 3-like [Spea bombifrons]